MGHPKFRKPQRQELTHLKVLRTQRLAPNWIRVTFGGGQIDSFLAMGYDQWFRLFLPISGAEGLDRVPAKANTLLGYVKFLRIPDGQRPVMRNYTVREFRPATASNPAELDVDFVLHGSAANGTAGPASLWAQTCVPGESVLIIDEGLSFNPDRGTERVVLVADETALPAIAGICASLPDTASGVAIIEVPDKENALEFQAPEAVEVQWVFRNDEHAVPGALALQHLRDTTLPPAPLHAYIAGEQALASGGRRFLVKERGIDRDQVSFTGYWKHGSASPASRTARGIASEGTR